MRERLGFVEREPIQMNRISEVLLVSELYIEAIVDQNNARRLSNRVHLISPMMTISLDIFKSMWKKRNLEIRLHLGLNPTSRPHPISQFLNRDLIMASYIDAESLENVPPAFTCPISYKLMLDPVILLQTGQSYDRASIEEWLKRGNTNDPTTGTQLKTTAMTTNWALRDVIRLWATDHGLQLPPPKSPGFYNKSPCCLGELDGTMAVVFDDGDFDPCVPLSQIIPRALAGSSESSQVTLSIGSLCWSPYQGRANCIYPGRILGVTKTHDPDTPPQTVAVDFDDGDHDSAVPIHQVYLDVFNQESDARPEEEKAVMEFGTRVWATYQGSSRVYPGVVTLPLPLTSPSDSANPSSSSNVHEGNAGEALDPVNTNQDDPPPPPREEETVIVSYDDFDFDHQVNLSTIQFLQPDTINQTNERKNELGRRCRAPWHGSTRLWDGRVLTEDESWEDVASKLNRAIQGLKDKSRRVLEGRRGGVSISEAYSLAKQVKWLIPADLNDNEGPRSSRLARKVARQAPFWIIGAGCSIALAWAIAATARITAKK